MDESMISSRHSGLSGKKKIPRKPRPVGIEIKNLCDGKTKINLLLEKCERKEEMHLKEYHEQFGATTACVLRLTKPYHGTGRTVFGDSWFGSFKSCEALDQVGLHSTFIVKTAHVNFPKLMLNNMGRLEIGQYHSCILPSQTATGATYTAVKYQDKKVKQIVSTFATTVPGEPRKKDSRRTGNITVVPRPQIFSEYCQYAGAIDVFNHFRTGGGGLEDSWRTHSSKTRQFSGLVGFVETNAFLAMRYFSPGTGSTLHSSFRKDLANALLRNSVDRSTKLTLRPTLRSAPIDEHNQIKYEDKKRVRCFYCANKDWVKITSYTSWYCELCGPKRGLCSPNTGKNCFAAHITLGFPKKRYRKNL